MCTISHSESGSCIVVLLAQAEESRRAVASQNLVIGDLLVGLVYLMDPDQCKLFLICAAAIVVNITVEAAIIYSTSHYNHIPYHTSALTGAAWVTELMNGHPERIHCELGIHLHVFQLIIEYLKIASGKFKKYLAELKHT